MADAFTERLTGQVHADDVSIEVGLVMTDTALLDGHDTPPRGCTRRACRARPSRPRSPASSCRTPPTSAVLRPKAGHGSGCAGCTRPRPTGAWSPWTRDDGGSTGSCAPCWSTATSTAAHHGAAPPYGMPTTSGRTPSGGPTSADNGQGLCAACNHTKELPGWAATRETSPPGPDFAHPDSTAAGSPHTVRVATATGHAYYLTPPPAPRHLGPTRARQALWRRDLA